MEEKNAKKIVPKINKKKGLSDNTVKKKKWRKYSCKTGYQKLAFGGINDVMKLIMSADELVEYDVDNLDFFNVSSIEKNGDKIKFEIFSRQEALDRLVKIEKDEENFENTLGFFNKTFDN